MFKIYIVPNELSDCIACFTNLNGDHLIITPSSILKCGINCNLITYSNKASGWAAQTSDSTSNRAAAQHSLHAYLLYILGTGSFHSMSLDSNYGWTLGVHGYEPVP